MDSVWIRLPFTFKRGEIISIVQRPLAKGPRDDREQFCGQRFNNIDPSQFWDYSGNCPPPPSRRQAAERYPNIYEYNLCVFTQTEVEVQMDS